MSILALTFWSFYGASVTQSSEQAPFTSETWVRSSMRTSLITLMWKEYVNALPKVVGFLRALRFLPQGKLTGWARIYRLGLVSPISYVAKYLRHVNKVYIHIHTLLIRPIKSDDLEIRTGWSLFEHWDEENQQGQHKLFAELFFSLRLVYFCIHGW